MEHLRPRLRQPPGRARDALLLRRRREGRRARFRRRRRSRPAPRRWSSSASCPSCGCRRSWSPTRGRRWRRSRRASTATRRPSCGSSGVTGTNGKTTTAFLLREILEAAAIQSGLLGTVKQVVGGVEEEVERTTPEAIDLQDDLQPHARGRRPRLRDGGLLARAGPAPGRRDPLRAGAVHQPDPGPPRLPRRHGGLLPRQAPALRRAGAGSVGRQRRRRLRAAAGRGIRVPDLLRRGRRRRLLRPRRLLRRLRRELHCDRPRGGDGGADAAARPLQRRQRAGGLRRRDAPWESTRTRPPPGWPGRARVPGRFEPIDEGQGFAVLVDYAHTPDSLENVLRRRPAADRGPGDRGLRRRRRPRPRQAAEDGAGRRRRSPTWRSSPPTTRAPRTRRRSSPKSSPGPRAATRGRGRARPAGGDRARASRAPSRATPW